MYENCVYFKIILYYCIPISRARDAFFPDWLVFPFMWESGGVNGRTEWWVGLSV